MDFSKGKIYAIRNYDNDKIYIGSTVQKLCSRMSSHRKDAKTRPHSIYKAMNEIGIDKFYIELIEDYPCENIEQLRSREGHFIRQFDSMKNGYNEKLAGRSEKERALEYYYEHQEEQIARSRAYREQHREELNERVREYGKKNKELIAERRRSKKAICPHCNKEMRKDSLNNHIKNKKCPNMLV
jgi:group I intron endonuclease